MKKGTDGIWRTVGGIQVSARQQAEFDARGGPPWITGKNPEEPTHRLFIVNPKMPTYAIEERECRIVVTEKITWAEPLMPIRGTARTQKRFMLGAYAFYTRPQAVKKKLIMLAQAMRAGNKQITLSSEAFKQLHHYKETGEVK